MKAIHQYKFHKTKYGEELLIDVVTLNSIRQHIDRHPVHTLSYYDITLITSDSGRFALNNASYSLHRGDILFSKPGEIRAWDQNDFPQGYALIFEEDFLLSFFNDPSFIQHLSYFHTDRTDAKMNILSIYPRIETLFQHILAEINNEQSKDRHILRALLYEMLTVLNREYLNTHTVCAQKRPNRHIDSFIKCVEKDFKTHHNTPYYAGKLCITPNYLNQIVRREMGTSPKGYIQSKIIQEAKTLLAYTDLSVAEIADFLHFESPSYFVRLFRQHTSLTPLQYRRGIMR